MQNLRQLLKCDEGIVRFRGEASLFKPLGVYKYIEA